MIGPIATYTVKPGQGKHLHNLANRFSQLIGRQVRVELGGDTLQVYGDEGLIPRLQAVVKNRPNPNSCEIIENYASVQRAEEDGISPATMRTIDAQNRRITELERTNTELQKRVETQEGELKGLDAIVAENDGLRKQLLKKQRSVTASNPYEAVQEVVYAYAEDDQRFSDKEKGIPVLFAIQEENGNYVIRVAVPYVQNDKKMGDLLSAERLFGWLDPSMKLKTEDVTGEKDAGVRFYELTLPKERYAPRNLGLLKQQIEKVFEALNPLSVQMFGVGIDYTFNRYRTAGDTNAGTSGYSGNNVASDSPKQVDTIRNKVIKAVASVFKPGVDLDRSKALEEIKKQVPGVQDAYALIIINQLVGLEILGAKGGRKAKKFFVTFDGLKKLKNL